LKVIECEPSLDRIVLSERAAQAGEGRRKQLFSSLKIGDVVKGKVTNITDFGVFLDLGGVEGLIHVSELSWGRVQHPGDILSIGDCAEAMVLQITKRHQGSPVLQTAAKKPLGFGFSEMYLVMKYRLL
jgi:small subunit ribosomal protein S1